MFYRKGGGAVEYQNSSFYLLVFFSLVQKFCKKYQNDDMEQNFPACSFSEVQTILTQCQKEKKNQPFFKLKTSLWIVL